MSRSRRLPECVTAGETGMVSLLSLLAVLGLLVLFGLLANIGKTAGQKLELQNGADGVAYSAGNEMARAMNTVTAVNHLIGELAAFVILHHGFGGDPLDGREQAKGTPRDAKIMLEATYNIAKFAAQIGSVTAPISQTYDQIKKDPVVGGAIWDSRIRLKHIATWAFTIHAVGGLLNAILGKIPVIGPILTGIIYIAFIGPALVFEGKALEESYVLDLVEYIAKATKPARQLTERVVIPALGVYARAVAIAAPLQMERAADEVAERNLVDGKLFPGFKNFSLPLLSMPLTREPERPRVPVRSQLLRAATPWVQYWRVPWLKFGEDALLLARFKPHYWDRTDEYALTLADRFRRERGVRLYHLDGYDPERQEKGTERWQTAGGSREADRLFAVVGFAHRGRLPVAGLGVFRQANPDGMAAYAQSFVYNANPNPRTAGGGFQPVVAYDTLNWVNRVRDHPGQRPRDTERYLPIPNVPEPRVRINWQVKLVPTTRVAESIWWQKGDLGQIMRRTSWVHIPLSGTH